MRVSKKNGRSDNAARLNLIGHPPAFVLLGALGFVLVALWVGLALGDEEILMPAGLLWLLRTAILTCQRRPFRRYPL
jgi:hypothetical protein